MKRLCSIQRHGSSYKRNTTTARTRVEEPGLHQKDGVLVHGSHGLIDGPVCVGEEGRVRAGRVHLVVSVAVVDVVGPELGYQKIVEGPAEGGKDGVRGLEEVDFCVRGIKVTPRRALNQAGIWIYARNGVGDVPGKPRENVDHPKLPGGVQDLLLQLGLAVDPLVVQGASPSLDVAHPLPGEESGPRKVLLKFGLCDVQRGVQLPPDVLLPREGEDEV